jgi:hypothetical protein
MWIVRLKFHPYRLPSPRLSWVHNNDSFLGQHYPGLCSSLLVAWHDRCVCPPSIARMTTAAAIGFRGAHHEETASHPSEFGNALGIQDRGCPDAAILGASYENHLIAHMREVDGSYHGALHVIAAVLAVSTLLPIVVSPPKVRGAKPRDWYGAAANVLAK